MDTGSPAFLRSLALNSKRARVDQDAAPSEASSSASRTAHRLFPDGGLLEFSTSSFFPSSVLFTHASEVDDKAISNEFITLVLAKTHSAIANFTDRANDEATLRRAISDIRLEMVSVVHKLHIFNGHWEMLSNEYATLKASLASFCTEPRPEAPEVIPLLPGVEL